MTSRDSDILAIRPPSEQAYVPLAKHILQQRLVRHIVLYTALTCWIQAFIWTVWLLGRIEQLGSSTFVAPFYPYTLLLASTMATFPPIIIRKAYLTTKPTILASPSGLVKSALSRRVLPWHICSPPSSYSFYSLSHLGFSSNPMHISSTSFSPKSSLLSSTCSGMSFSTASFSVSRLHHLHTIWSALSQSYTLWSSVPPSRHSARRSHASHLALPASPSPCSTGYLWFSTSSSHSLHTSSKERWPSFAPCTNSLSFFEDGL